MHKPTVVVAGLVSILPMSCNAFFFAAFAFVSRVLRSVAGGFFALAMIAVCLGVDFFRFPNATFVFEFARDYNARRDWTAWALEGGD